MVALSWAASPEDLAAVDALGVVAGADRTTVTAEARATAEATVAQRFPGDDLPASLRAACDDGDVVACAGSGWFGGFVDGRPSAEAPTPQAAVADLERACAKGFLRSCVAHARLVQRGIGAPGDPADAATRFRAACDRGEPRGCLWLAKAHQIGAGVPQDADAVRQRAEAACTDTLPSGCNTLAMAWHFGTGGDKDLGKALALYQQACAGGFAPSCDNLGPLYQGGLPDVPDREHLLREACDAAPPQASACAHLGDALAATEPPSAHAAYRLACDAKLARGCRGVALLVLDARVPGDEAEAFELLEGACEVGEPAACARWGDELATGRRVPRDLALAFEARAAACDSGHGPACVAGAAQRKKGKGVDKDKAAAAEMLQRACVLGVDDVCP